MRTHEAELLHIYQEVLEALNSMVMDVGPSSHPPGDVIGCLEGWRFSCFIRETQATFCLLLNQAMCAWLGQRHP